MEEDYQAILEDHWKAMKARTVNRGRLVHKDLQRLSSSLQDSSRLKATRETQVLLDRVARKEEEADEETSTV